MCRATGWVRGEWLASSLALAAALDKTRVTVEAGRSSPRKDSNPEISRLPRFRLPASMVELWFDVNASRELERAA